MAARLSLSDDSAHADGRRARVLGERLDAVSGGLGAERSRGERRPRCGGCGGWE